MAARATCSIMRNRSYLLGNAFQILRVGNEAIHIGTRCFLQLRLAGLDDGKRAPRAVVAGTENGETKRCGRNYAASITPPGEAVLLPQ